MRPESVSASIVLLGQFSVSSFLPKRLRGLGVLSDEDALSVDYVQLVHEHLLEYNFPWAQVSVASTRVQIQTDQTPYVRIGDFLRSVLAQVSSDLKVVALGINLHCHFRLDHTYQRDRIGLTVLPVEPWGKWGQKIKEQIDGIPSPFRHGGMVSATMQKKLVNDKDGIKGHTDVTVQPSAMFPDTGIFVAINNHFQGVDKLDLKNLASSDVIDQKMLLLNVLDSRFDSVLAESQEITQELLEGKK